MTGILRHRAVLFVDISGSSRLYVELGDSHASERVRECLGLLQRVVEANAGRLIKAIGDGLMCDFDDANQALQAAQEMQVSIAESRRDAWLPGIHVGCHYGPVIENEGDLYGDAVNLAARIAGVAHAGQIIMTQETVEQLSEERRELVRVLSDVSVKGRLDALTVLEYLWRPQSDLTRPHRTMTLSDVLAARSRNVRLRLVFREREVWLDRAASAITLGRDSSCGLEVQDPGVSRQHATIEIRGDKVVIVDHSSNGTYVAWDQESETWLRREEMILPPRGRISLGRSTRAPHATIVEFFHDL
jgi:class 3 adenylate cyclase